MKWLKNLIQPPIPPAVEAKPKPEKDYMEVRRWWKNSNPNKGPLQMTNMIYINGRVPWPKFILYVQKKVKGIDSYDKVFVNGSVRWEDEPNEEELAENAEWKRKNDERHAAWEKRIYAELYEKFGGRKPDD